MSDERETHSEPGAAVEEQAAGETAVQDAVDRAQAIVDEASLGAETTSRAAAGALDAANESAAEAVAAATAAGSVAVEATSEAATAEAAAEAAQAAADAAATEYARQAQVASLDTQIDMELPKLETPVIAPEELPSSAAPLAAAVPLTEPARDGEIRISADHPMAALYMQSPMPPELKGNRTAGVLIALLGTLAFAVLYAGLISVMLAPQFPPSTFLSEGLLPWVTSWGFIAGVVAFFIGLSILVLIFGRAGWWAYVLFSLFVGVAVWGASTALFALTGDPNSSAAAYAKLIGQPAGEFGTTLSIAKVVAFGIPTLGAGLLAREVAVWFGAWIGARGRKVTAKNAELIAEYEKALSEVQVQA